ncbi:Major Facilitator Superfamily protein [Chitinophaga sp. YR573]|uniref:MFS transporter n=1 Tax=Chitinophaga sp. YR573 TaxID=1881040 RepID=UPI0008D819A5|nr:MFS transporter [Chitinophaga sp. YR573]SEW39628.1 Major Facilitator Superfamily protein [Chitinophaga sp. YR573]
MKLRFFLIFMTMVAVVSDYLLHPFYPHFFESRFGITDPREVGFYFSAVCGTVMVAFPLWALVSRKRSELRILVYTQIIAGILAIGVFFITSYVYFWIVSLSIIVFKGSYLLVYPYILRITKKEDHTNVIGLLSVIIHFGSVLGAVLGGIVIDFAQPAYIFLAMAAGDFIQAGMSMYLLKSKWLPVEEKLPPQKVKVSLIPKGNVLKLGIITMFLYYSDFITRPFFVRYWESLSVYNSRVISGCIYAIPALVALFALWFNKKRKSKGSVYQGIVSALLFGLAGLILQGYPLAGVVILGRFIYGWAFFQAAVRFDVLVFNISDPESYAIEYSKIHFFQNLGVLMAAFSAGILVNTYSLRIPFIVAFGGYFIVTSLYYYAFRTQIKKPVLQPETIL